MSAAIIFSIANALVLPGWILLLAAPRWKPGRDLIAGTLTPLALGLLYAVLFAVRLGSAPEGAGFGSLAAVAALFSDEWLLLVGWIHYLAFDLFVGAWEVRDAQRRGIHHLAVVPCLVLTFLAGPAGLAIYLILRGLWKRSWNAEETASA